MPASHRKNYPPPSVHISATSKSRSKQLRRCQHHRTGCEHHLLAKLRVHCDCVVKRLAGSRVVVIGHYGQDKTHCDSQVKGKEVLLEHIPEGITITITITEYVIVFGSHLFTSHLGDLASYITKVQKRQTG